KSRDVITSAEPGLTAYPAGVGRTYLGTTDGEAVGDGPVAWVGRGTEDVADAGRCVAGDELGWFVEPQAARATTKATTLNTTVALARIFEFMAGPRGSCLRPRPAGAVAVPACPATGPTRSQTSRQ